MKLRLFTIVFVASCLLSSCVKDEIPSEVVEYIDEYGINHGPGIKIGPHVWAPVNCGYHATDYKYGKLYQWGRKYGQGFGDDASVPVLEDGGVSLEVGNDKSKENVYFTSSYDLLYDWLAPQNGKLWNQGAEFEPVKTEYDPCPEGWRVPVFAELDELCRNHSSRVTDVHGCAGYWFCGAKSYSKDVPQIFLSMNGSVDSYSGTNSNRDLWGYYWSSTSRTYDSYCIAFHEDTIFRDPPFSDRVSGYSVRCIRVTDEVAEL